MTQSRRVVVLANDVSATSHDGVLPSYASQRELDDTTAAIVDALAQRGWHVDVLMVTDSVATLGDLLAPLQPDLVFNVVEALNGDDLRGHEAAAMLEQLGTPFTGTSAALFLLTCQKELPRAVLQAHGVQIGRAHV